MLRMNRVGTPTFIGKQPDVSTHDLITADTVANSTGTTHIFSISDNAPDEYHAGQYFHTTGAALSANHTITVGITMDPLLKPEHSELAEISMAFHARHNGQEGDIIYFPACVQSATGPTASTVISNGIRRLTMPWSGIKEYAATAGQITQGWFNGVASMWPNNHEHYQYYGVNILTTTAVTLSHFQCDIGIRRNIGEEGQPRYGRFGTR
jgi:hypothetical protein